MKTGIDILFGWAFLCIQYCLVMYLIIFDIALRFFLRARAADPRITFRS